MQRTPITKTVSELITTISGTSVSFHPHSKWGGEEHRFRTYRIPVHQRFYKWNHTQQKMLIDSIITGFPIQSLVVVSRIDIDIENPRAYYDIEDGQSRLTTLWLFINNRFTISLDDEETCYDDLTMETKMKILNYRIPIEQVEFTGILTRREEQTMITELFIRLQMGKPLSDNDKYHASDHEPCMQMLSYIKSEYNATIEAYCGKVGEGKTKPMLSDFCSAILSVGHNNIEYINSFSENYEIISTPFTAEGKTRILSFFANYVALVSMRVPTGSAKIYGKMSKFLGYCVISYINDPRQFPQPHLVWYLQEVVNNAKFVPTTFHDLAPGDQRNCRPLPVHRRSMAILDAYNNRGQEQPDNMSLTSSDDEE
tara:strand:- start:3487 stop:4593 length:1107 start_codon:yes stop_codon:yes gene_type:complete